MTDDNSASRLCNRSAVSATWRLTSTSLSNCAFTTLLTVDPAIVVRRQHASTNSSGDHCFCDPPHS